jgi:serine/threonine-protein kinase
MGEGASGKQVTLTHGFYLDRTEVTVHDYEECMEKRACSNADHVSLTADVAPDAATPENTATDTFAATWGSRCNLVRKAEGDPINCVDFANAAGYCRFRGRRLPTEAEWELAARSAVARPFVWGDGAAQCESACYDRNGGCLGRGSIVSTCAAGSHPRDKTPEGILDLAGNVSEWVSDGFMSPLPGGADPIGDPASPLRVLRGGSFLDDADKLHGSWRTAASPVTAHVSIGFRCALDAPPDGGTH